jgi:hypothetical protein
MTQSVSSFLGARFPGYHFLDSISLDQRVIFVACLALACVAYCFRHLFYTPQTPQNESSQLVVLGSPLTAAKQGPTSGHPRGPVEVGDLTTPLELEQPPPLNPLGEDPPDTSPLTLEDLVTPAAATGNAVRDDAPASNGQSSSKFASSTERSKIILSDSQLVESAFLKKTGRGFKGSPHSLKGSRKSPKLARGYIVVSRRTFKGSTSASSVLS